MHNPPLTPSLTCWVLALNNNYYGSRAYGIRAAATEYFGISDLTLLTLGQAALLAAIPTGSSINIIAAELDR